MKKVWIAASTLDMRSQVLTMKNLQKLHKILGRLRRLAISCSGLCAGLCPTWCLHYTTVCRTSHKLHNFMFFSWIRTFVPLYSWKNNLCGVVAVFKIILKMDNGVIFRGQNFCWHSRKYACEAVRTVLRPGFAFAFALNHTHPGTKKDPARGGVVSD